MALAEVPHSQAGEVRQGGHDACLCFWAAKVSPGQQQARQTLQACELLHQAQACQVLVPSQAQHPQLRKGCQRTRQQRQLPVIILVVNEVVTLIIRAAQNYAFADCVKAQVLERSQAGQRMHQRAHRQRPTQVQHLQLTHLHQLISQRLYVCRRVWVDPPAALLNDKLPPLLQASQRAPKACIPKLVIFEAQLPQLSQALQRGRHQRAALVRWLPVLADLQAAQAAGQQRQHTTPRIVAADAVAELQLHQASG